VWALALAAGVVWMTGDGAHGAAYTSTLAGSVKGFKLAGVEPDGDPLYQVVLQTRLSSSNGLPPLNLIVSSYLENFTPDTTPILPDVLHPSQTAQNLGGFLQGKVLLTDDAGNVLSIGSFVAEAFLDNTNHAAMKLYGGPERPSHLSKLIGSLAGAFRIQRNASLSGRLTGHLSLGAAILRQIVQHRGMRMKPLEKIISTVTVKPAPMVGRRTPGANSTPLPTGYGTPQAAGSSGRGLNPWSIVAGVGAIVSLLLAAILYIRDRRKQHGRPQESGAS
jgi:hypothetical protein